MVKIDILSSRLFLSDNQKTENTEQTGIFRNLTSQLGVHGGSSMHFIANFAKRGLLEGSKDINCFLLFFFPKGCS